MKPYVLPNLTTHLTPTSHHTTQRISTNPYNHTYPHHTIPHHTTPPYITSPSYTTTHPRRTSSLSRVDPEHHPHHPRSPHHPHHYGISAEALSLTMREDDRDEEDDSDEYGQSQIIRATTAAASATTNAFGNNTATTATLGLGQGQGLAQGLGQGQGLAPLTSSPPPHPTTAVVNEMIELLCDIEYAGSKCWLALAKACARTGDWAS